MQETRQEKKIEFLDTLDEILFRETYTALQKVSPEHPALKAASIKSDGVYLQQEFFDHYGHDPSQFRANVGKYYIALKIANGSW